MNNKQLPVILGIGAILAVIVGFTIYSRSHALPSASTTPASVAEDTYSMEKVAEHKDASSCWTTMDGNVYDLTTWITQHPGGKDAILMICGKDGSAAFHEQHGMNKQEADILATFKIGTLAK